MVRSTKRLTNTPENRRFCKVHCPMVHQWLMPVNAAGFKMSIFQRKKKNQKRRALFL